MTKAPGHQKWPGHEIREEQVGEELAVEVNGEVVARSTHVIEVDEDKHPIRHYFPRDDVEMDRLELSRKSTECPFKGRAKYFHVRVGEQKLENAAWSYEDPYDEHRDLAGRIAFHEDEMAEIRLAVGAAG